MRMNRTTAILATIGAAALGYLAVSAYRRYGEPRGHGSALSDEDRFVAKDVSATRSAGPDAMRDPPREWTDADQAVDESFPASDPGPVGGSRVD